MKKHATWGGGLLVGLTLAASLLAGKPALQQPQQPLPIPTENTGPAKAVPSSYAVSNAPYTQTLRSVALEDLAARNILPLGIYKGSPQVNAKRAWYEENFYNTLAARKVWRAGTSLAGHERAGPVTWDVVPIPQKAPPPCDQPQPTGYDAEGCRYVNSLFTEIKDPAKAKLLREQARRGRDVWYKGTFGNQDENYQHLSRSIGEENMYYPWLDTRYRKERFTRWGLINDPDCVQGDASTFWMDKCADEHSSGVIGYRKYFAEPTKDKSGKVVFDPTSSPYQPDELKKNLRYVIGHPCVQCHAGFDPTHPPQDPNEPKWEDITGLIGNQHTVQPTTFIEGTPHNAPARQVLMAGRPGTIDTSIVANDFMNNPGTQNNIMDFMNRRVFEHDMKDQFTGKISKGLTQHVLKGGEDSVGDHLALIRVYVNIGMCTEECWVPNFPVPGQLIGAGAKQKPFRIQQCAKDCEAWNFADAKMPDLASFLVTGGPTYLLKAKDSDGTPGTQFVDLSKVPQGRKVFARECAGCHSTKVAPENIRRDKDQLARFYEGHVFGLEDYWMYEFNEKERTDAAFIGKYLAKDASGKLRPKQFIEKGMYAQDWLGNDEATPFNVVGTNSCRALHDNHNKGHIWEEFASETYQNRASPGSVPVVLNRMVTGEKTVKVGEHKIEGGPGYYRNISLLSVWATSPFLHNNAIGELTYLKDGKTIDYTVRGRIKQFEMAFDELMRSDNPKDKGARTPKISRTTLPITIGIREDLQGPIQLPVKAGTPIAYFTSSDPHHAAVMKCDDLVENKGHQFGVDLSAEDKLSLREFLKLM